MARYWFKVVIEKGYGVGFELAGAPVEEVTLENAAERLQALLTDGKTGVVAIDDQMVQCIPAALNARIRREGFPVIVPFTVPRRGQDAARGQDYVAALIQRAIGYHVKIQR
jgi:V/A-type H+-transporting ATPase subunit F